MVPFHIVEYSMAPLHMTTSHRWIQNTESMVQLNIEVHSTVLLIVEEYSMEPLNIEEYSKEPLHVEEYSKEPRAT